jgi:hypothetical protein
MPEGYFFRFFFLENRSGSHRGQRILATTDIRADRGLLRAAEAGQGRTGAPSRKWQTGPPDVLLDSSGRRSDPDPDPDSTGRQGGRERSREEQAPRGGSDPGRGGPPEAGTEDSRCGIDTYLPVSDTKCLTCQGEQQRRPAAARRSEQGSRELPDQGQHKNKSASQTERGGHGTETETETTQWKTTGRPRWPETTAAEGKFWIKARVAACRDNLALIPY